jgi:hypothetical protein
VRLVTIEGYHHINDKTPKVNASMIKTTGAERFHIMPASDFISHANSMFTSGWHIYNLGVSN